MALLVGHDGGRALAGWVDANSAEVGRRLRSSVPSAKATCLNILLEETGSEPYAGTGVLSPKVAYCRTANFSN